jgi:hypothetical protein
LYVFDVNNIVKLLQVDAMIPSARLALYVQLGFENWETTKTSRDSHSKHPGCGGQIQQNILIQVSKESFSNWSNNLNTPPSATKLLGIIISFKS